MESQRSSHVVRTGAAAVVVAVALALGACGSDDESSSSSGSSGGSSSSDAKKEIKVGLAQPTPNNDHSFGEATHNGAVKAQADLGVKLTEVDSLTTPRAQTSALQNLARSNELVLMDGAISSQGISSKFPKVHFVVTDGTLPAAPNNHSVHQDWHPVAYLAGVAAAKTSKTHTIGFIGGIPIPVILDAQKGYTAGAKSVDPNIKVLHTTIGSFTDSTKGKDAANAQIAGGADVLYADLDTAHTGIVQAAKAKGNVHVIGSVAPKCDISQGTDIGDTVFDQARIVFTTIQDYVKDGSLPATLTFGLKGGYSSFQLCPGASADVKKAVADAHKGLLSGEIDANP
jgi:basic membrane protein A and related proteins